jgi:hypothetical protein
MNNNIFLGRSHGLTLNGTGEPQVDMLDIPGKGRCCVFIARFSYDPPEYANYYGKKIKKLVFMHFFFLQKNQTIAFVFVFWFSFFFFFFFGNLFFTVLKDLKVNWHCVLVIIY